MQDHRNQLSVKVIADPYVQRMLPTKKFVYARMNTALQFYISINRLQESIMFQASQFVLILYLKLGNKRHHIAHRTLIPLIHKQLKICKDTF